MTINHPASVNIDALWLRTFAETNMRLNEQDESTVSDEDCARLLRIADNIDGLDHANSQAYALGVTEGEARVYARSNLLQESASISKRQGRSLLDILNNTPITKVPMGVRALEDKPADFNPRKPQAKRPTLAIDLDLSDI